MRKTSIALLLILSLVMVVAACGKTAPQAKTPIKIGVVVSMTGGASSLGEAEKNTFELFKSKFGTVAGHPVEWIVQDDESDSTKAVLAVKRLIEEDKVAAVVCCTTSPNSMAILEAVQGAKVPNISMAAAASIVQPVSERYWVFKTPQNDALMIDILTDYMAAHNHKKVAFIGFNDAYGDSGKKELEALAPGKGITVTAKESFARTDTDATAQVTKMAGTGPDAYLIWAIPPGANVAHRNIKDLKLTQPVYQSHGVANASFLQLGGEAVEGTLMPAGKLLIADQLPDTDPQKQVLLEYKQAYEAQYGAGKANTFGGHAYDAMLILSAALERTISGGGSPDDIAAFRASLRDEIEKTKEVVGISGIFNYTAEDHHGLDRRAAVMITIQNGNWTLLKD